MEKVDNRKWWNQLDENWQKVFKKAIGIKLKPIDSDLEEIVNLQVLNYNQSEISDLEPLRALTNLQVLACMSNHISDLEPLRTLTNLQGLDCHLNQISDSEKNKFKKAVPNCEVIERRMRPMHH